jgi:hypothetical protein
MSEEAQRFLCTQLVVLSKAIRAIQQALGLGPFLSLPSCRSIRNLSTSYFFTFEEKVPPLISYRICEISIGKTEAYVKIKKNYVKK